MVFQDYALFPHMSVTDNISLPVADPEDGPRGTPSEGLETGAGLGLET